MTPDELRKRIIVALYRVERDAVTDKVADGVLPVVREAIAAELDAAAEEMYLSEDERRCLDRAARWRQT